MWACGSVDRASDSGSEGRGFKSLHAREKKRKIIAAPLGVVFFAHGNADFPKIAHLPQGELIYYELTQCCTNFCREPMAEPIPPITLPPITDPAIEGTWLEQSLQKWLDEEFLPEPANQQIALRARQIYVRQRLEGENDLGSLVIAIVTEMRSFNFTESFYGEFAVANAVSDLILESLGIDRCCGN